MKIEKENVIHDSTSCNFCDKGKLKMNRASFEYQYTDVITFTRGGRGGVKAAICEDCLDDLYVKGKECFKNEK